MDSYYGDGGRCNRPTGGSSPSPPSFFLRQVVRIKMIIPSVMTLLGLLGSLYVVMQTPRCKLLKPC